MKGLGRDERHPERVWRRFVNVDPQFSGAERLVKSEGVESVIWNNSCLKVTFEENVPSVLMVAPVLNLNGPHYPSPRRHWTSLHPLDRFG